MTIDGCHCERIYFPISADECIARVYVRKQLVA